MNEEILAILYIFGELLMTLGDVGVTPTNNFARLK